jgi:ABC-type nitrate/sulfonate/bicarbonate transport system substrate-binding protein
VGPAVAVPPVDDLFTDSADLEGATMDRTKKRRRYRPAAAVAGLAATGLLAACSSSTSTSAVTSAAGSTACTAPSSVTIGELPVPVNLDMVVADGLGLFAKVGAECHTSVKLQIFASPPTELPALTSGQIQFIDVGTANVLAAAGQQQSILGLANTAQGGTGFMIAPAADKANGTLLTGMAHYSKGVIWAVPGLGGPGQLGASMLISAAGGSPSDVRFAAVGVPGLVPAIESGKAGAATVSPAPAVAAIKTGQAYSIIYTSGASFYKQFGFLSGTIFSTTPAFEAKYPVFTQKIVAAEVQALIALQQDYKNPAAVYKLLPASYRATETEAVWAQSWSYVDGVNAGATGLITQQDLQHELGYETKFGILPSSTTLPGGLTDDTDVRSAYKQLGLAPPAGPVDLTLLNQLPNT